MAVTISGTTGVGVSTTPQYPSDIAVGTLGTTANSQLVGARLLGVAGTNGDTLEISQLRGTAGTDWTTAGWRLQERVDGTWMGYIQFNGTASGANNNGISIGTGSSTVNANSVPEKLRIDSSGNVTPGVTTAQNLGSASLLWSNTYSNKFVSPNTTATSLTDGSIILNGTSGAILLDDSAQKRISWNDGGGNLTIRSGNYFTTAAVYAKGAADANGGAATITLSSDAVDGSISLNVAAIGVPAATVTYANSLTLSTTSLSTTADLYFNSGYGSAALAFGCRAWVNFNGTGTIAIRADGNVSTLGDNGVGDYTINFTTAMVDANYAPCGLMATLSGTSIRAIAGGAAYSQTTGALRVQTWSNSVVNDADFVTIAIFR